MTWKKRSVNPGTRASISLKENDDNLLNKILLLRGERDQSKFIDLRFERWHVVRFRKARRKQDFA